MAAWDRLFRIEVALLIMASLLSACGQANQPPSDEIEAALSDAAGSLYQYEISNKEYFASSGAGQGRVSVSGDLVANEDLFRQLSPEEVSQEYGAAGILNAHIVMIKRLISEPIFIKKQVRKGERTPANVELFVQKQATGWKIDQTESVRQVVQRQENFQPRSAFPQNAELVDSSDAPFMVQAKSISAEISRSDAELLDKFKRKYLDGQTLSLKFWQKVNLQKSIRNDSPFSLKFTKMEFKPGPEIDQFYIFGDVIMNGVPSSDSGSINALNSQFTPVKKVRIDALMLWSGNPGNIKSEMNLTMHFQDTFERYRTFHGSASFFDGGKIKTSDQNSIFNWRWED